MSARLLIFTLVTEILLARSDWHSEVAFNRIRNWFFFIINQINQMAVLNNLWDVFGED